MDRLPAPAPAVVKAEKRSKLCCQWLSRRSTQEIKVEILSDELVKPSTPNTLIDPLIPLSVVDNANMLHGWVQFVAWLPPLPSDSIIDYDTFLTMLKTNLRATLSLFCPLAGRLVETDGGLAIDCNDAGVRFRAAKADYPLAVGLPTEPFKKLTKLLGCNVVWEKTTKDAPLMVVQTTMFEDRRIATFLAFHHGVVDGASIAHFVTAWLKGTKVAQNPCLDRSLIRALGKPESAEHPFLDCPGGRFTLLRRLMSWSLGRALLSMVPQTLLFPAIVQKKLAFAKIRLEVLKQEASKDLGAGIEYVTTSDAVTALIWRAVCRARGQPGNQEVRLLTIVDMRGRFSSVPANYFGNAVLPVMTDHVKVRALLAEPLGRTASRVRVAINKYGASASYIQETLNWMGAQTQQHAIGFKIDNDVDFGVSSLVGMTGNSLEVGFGKASLTTRIPRAGVANLLTDAQGSESDISVQIGLYPKHVGRFETDVELQRFVG